MVELPLGLKAMEIGYDLATESVLFKVDRDPTYCST